MTSSTLGSYATTALEQIPNLNLERLRALVKDAPAWKLGLGAGLGYLALVRLLRYRKRNQIARKFPYKSRADFKNMTADEAQVIFKMVFETEFPFLAEKSLQFALFR